MSKQFNVNSRDLYYYVDRERLPFKTTRDIKANIHISGQNVAKEALTFAIKCHAKGMNAYVRGLPGTLRKTLVRQVIKEIKPKARRQQDYCYVHNFNQPNNPRLVILECGCGKVLKKMLSSLCDYIVNDLPKTLNSGVVRQQRKDIETKNNRELEKLYKSFKKTLKENALALATVSEGNSNRMVILPIYKGELLTQEQAGKLLKKGDLSEKEMQEFNRKIAEFQDQLVSVTEKSNLISEQNYRNIQKIDNDFAREQLSEHLDAISKKFSNQSLDVYLEEVIDYFIENVLYNNKKNFNPSIFCEVNILTDTYKDDNAPVIFEDSPTLLNLLGTAESEGRLPPYASISAGSLIKADGGFLIIEIDEALAESGTWAFLMRTIRSRKLSFAFEDNFGGRKSIITPEPIPIDVKFILIGSHKRFYELGFYQGDFLDNFKVLVDLDSELLRSKDTYLQYAQILRKIIDEEKLLHFNVDAVARLIELGIRLSRGKEKVSSNFGRILDIAREANYLACKDKEDLVGEQHIVAAINDRKIRSYAPARQFFEMLESGTIIIATEGLQIGQINGLAVSQAGMIRYGFPARITATISPGKLGLINIEGQAELSGNIHTKGFQILGGLLRYLLRPEHPLSFSASIAFEQSYGGIEGDSASGAEACCLLSALTQVPIKQSLSMTGAIDQFGQLQAIGGVNEKIEGFFDCCNQKGLNNEQGVIIPIANVDNLMLRNDVVKACENGQFHIYAVDHVLDALAILTDTKSCKDMLLNKLPYHPESLLANASKQVSILFRQSQS